MFLFDFLLNVTRVTMDLVHKFDVFSFLEDMEQYLHYIGGGAGALALTGVAAASAFYLASRPTTERLLWPIDDQALLEGPEQIRVSRFSKDCKDGKFVKHLYNDATTLYECFRRGAKISNNGRCLGWRESFNKPYQWIHYNETLLRAKNVGSGMVAMGLPAGTETFVGIYAQNCPEWIIAEQAIYCYSMVLVPLYDTLGPDACAFIIKQVDMHVVICEDDQKCNLLLDRAPKCLRRLICIKEVRPATKQRAKNRGVEIVKFSDVETLGTKNNHPEMPPKPSDLCTICYTSGTTGNPKGVMLTHENVVASFSAVMMQFGDHKLKSDDVMISFLPLAHMLERCCENAMYMEGGAVGFYSGDIRRLSDDMKALKPTISPAVPRLLNRIYDKIQSEVSRSCIKKMLFNMAMSAKENELKRGILRRNSFWDMLVFRKVQEGMGGRLRLMLVGSAPLAENVLNFTRCALGCMIVEGYGQTECCAPITLTVQGDHIPGHVGPPVSCCCVKLVDVPEMEYWANKSQGEVCVKGTNVFQGYFKDPEKTEETIDDNGWHHTGDVGMWLPNGCLKIIDRKKHIFKLSQGEYIVPEKIENIYIRSQYVQQVFVHGESLKSCIVAIVVPDVDVIKCWAQENGIPGTLSVLCNHSEVKQLIMDDMLSWGKECGLKSFEQIKDLYLHPDPFSVQNGLLTPTMKSKRPQIKSYFTPQLEDMYKKLA
ncbi:PREDICTED: long-chain-fatty-acid--CoA ligase 5 isoform X2 [Nicrophorus vespilloides]|uniref:Long-chain-fatty-acid--CoA ligase n=1 Tax=Nicrophorus vespilloides TaxID=110193 RepID=A0ABM1N1S0_NICVS|nr:PREDICTED: long-chain-fatty-acid--CoA ligase 5 isoform X2 [Nicrophorus vespilloides]XP_017780768.1 PREDICTED: long-chain-fatty-acid--CoA ligase 5 isoform X2 [Nicrophorus vespilloides]XP_017780769.1 PREDICTED: long-chain-fatty-acid--CoA ligase 5 isoform X2 [Nicrophorus vespilloides]XP_017780770.1 PREDICTED: long-chain-fatty-acid--CoA ligase 5 isoform X2 [Nicrophorus vespilloides]